tara:strand:+ start:346 stop:729 length:384 start_codon:yes stop_codon:yes gene_type:complete
MPRLKLTAEELKIHKKKTRAKYYEKNRAKIIASMKIYNNKYYAKFPEKKFKYTKEYYKKNKITIKNANKKYYQKNIDLIKKKQAKYRQENRMKIKAKRTAKGLNIKRVDEVIEKPVIEHKAIQLSWD